MNTLKNSYGLLPLLSKALNLWIRSKCDKVGELNLQLEGSTLRLLKGNLSAVRIIAREVIFEGILFEKVDLISGSIHFSLDFKKYLGSVILKKPFVVDGNAVIAADDLNNLLNSSSWSWLGLWMAEQLFQAPKLGELTIRNDLLEFEGPQPCLLESIDRRFSISAVGGTISINNKGRNISVLLPMDEGIYIKRAFLSEGNLCLNATAKITA